uniref:Plastocyanin-like domain-containing protein n=1 Tax=Aegilops tauschii subsp. strangulata TaxID=200361 RepID=A0A453BP24_AEGTS
IKQRKNSWQDGVAGTNCPIPPGANYTYKFQAKDQIGTFTYFPSVALHRAAGGFGALNVYQRPAIPVPYPPPAGDFTLLVGDWYLAGHDQLRQTLDSGAPLPFPDALLINGMPSATLVGDQGRQHSHSLSSETATENAFVTVLVLLSFREDLSVESVQCRDEDVDQLQDPGPCSEAGGGGRHAPGAERLRLPRRARRPVRGVPRHPRPAGHGLRRGGVDAVQPGRHQPVDGGRDTALQQRHLLGAWPAPGRTAGGERVVDEPGKVVPVEPDSQRGAAQPAGVVPLRHYPDVEDAGLGQLRCRRRWAETVRRERRLVRRPGHASEAPGQLQHRKRDRMGQCPGAARRRGTPARDAGGEAQPARVRGGGVPEHRERDAVLAS